MKYILLGGCSLHQCVHSARCGKMYVGVMCPVFSSAHARVNACASALVYTPEYKYNFSCTSLQRLSGLDTYVLVCGRTRRLSLSRSLSRARARALMYSRTRPHASRTHRHTHTRAHTHTPTHTHTHTHVHECVWCIDSKSRTRTRTHTQARTRLAVAVRRRVFVRREHAQMTYS